MGEMGELAGGLTPSHPARGDSSHYSHSRSHSPRQSASESTSRGRPAFDWSFVLTTRFACSSSTNTVVISLAATLLLPKMKRVDATAYFQIA